MKNTQNKSGFTLVELIIVITILAVLATIAFVSFQGYAADSRDAKVVSEIGSLRSNMEIRSAEGVSLMSMVASTGSNLTNISLGGTGAVEGTEYKAGDINFAVLGADASKFTNDNFPYKAWVSTKVGGVYQLAGKLEKTGAAHVVGNYSARKDGLSLSGTVTDATNFRVTLDDPANAGKFKIGDVLSVPVATIIWVSSDLTVITLDADPAGATTYTLSGSESPGLIAVSSSNTTTALVHNEVIIP